MKPRRNVPPTGQIRQSQLITTFGPGAMVDLPDHSVIVCGLEQWSGEKHPIYEKRLEAKLQERLKEPSLGLYAPPVDSSDPNAPRSGVAVTVFPAWFLGQVDETWTDPDGKVYRTRPLIRWDRLVKGKYLDRGRKLQPVVPVRFVQACIKGHISDIDWYAFVNHRFDAPRTGDLWFDEGGAGNDFAEIFVRHENGNRRPLSDAKVPNVHVLGKCQGHQPWLGPRMRAKCDEPNRLLTRAASNAYFSQQLRVISIPDANEELVKAVDRVWEDFLLYCESLDDLRKERRREKVASALEGLKDEAVWQEVQRRKQGVEAEVRSIKQVEVETLLTQQPSLGEDKPDGDFYARTHPIEDLPPSAEGKVDKLVLVHRLREVTAQVGFTRFESSLPDIDGELDLGVELAPLAREQTWLPAFENRGEGIFISFAKDAIDEWLKRPAVVARREQLIAGFDVWKDRKSVPDANFPGMPYIMLHSLSHLLITAVSLDCGYSSSAIRERIYGRDTGYGILLYTGTPGSEGTLGGLVDMGKQIGRHLAHALELGRLCSNDPVCSQHEPTNSNEERFLHGAACHGCVLIAETSCERGNDMLDRALVVPTVDTEDAAFFNEV